jgi:hypothetical protein
MKYEKNYLHKNITRLSAIVTSGLMITDYSDDDDEWFTFKDKDGRKLSDYQMHMHIGALIENLKEFSKTIDNSWTSCK